MILPQGTETKGFLQECPEKLILQTLITLLAEHTIKTDWREYTQQQIWVINTEIEKIIKISRKNLVKEAISELGALKPGERYCLKIPAVIGGDYKVENIGKIKFGELISNSGDLAYQIKDLDDGQEIELKIIN